MKFTFIKPATRERRHFTSFYSQYASPLWGLILLAELLPPVAETILVNTFSKAWQHPRRQLISEPEMLTWLLRLAYEEGLPFIKLPPAFRQSVRIPSAVRP